MKLIMQTCPSFCGQLKFSHGRLILVRLQNVASVADDEAYRLFGW